MRILFVHSEEDFFSVKKPLESFDRMQFGISYISSLLKEKGHKTRLVVPTPETLEVIEEHISKFDPGLVCFTSVYSVYEFLESVARDVKKNHPDLPIAVGGPYPTLRPEECLDPFDIACVGEGEYATLELVEQLERGEKPSGIPNLCIRKENGEIEKNPPRPFLEDIDSLPFPDRDMWIPWLANPLSRPSVLAGRGCPFQCTYCSNHALKTVADGKYVRHRKPEAIAEEIKEIKTKFPLLEEIYLEVEDMCSVRGWALGLCKSLEEMNAGFELPIRFGANLRVTPNTDFEELFTACEKANFRFVNIGLESGSERVRRDILKRNYSNEDIITAVETLRRHDMQVGFYNLIGIPGETKEDFKETIRVNRICQPDWYLLSVFYPYPGTRLYDVCEERGLLNADFNRKLERRQPGLKLPEFSKRQIKRRYNFSPLLIYGGHRPKKEVLRHVILSEIYSSIRLTRWWRKLTSHNSPYKQFEDTPVVWDNE